jgi:pimeloyl-ACP methyl ester carboxylesterase
MLRKDYDWSRDVAAIKSPTLLVFGDADAVRTAHAVQFFELLGGGKKDGGWDGSGISNARLAILPGITHYTIFSSPALASTVNPFLEAPMPRTK